MLKLFLGENCLLLELATDMPETINSVSGGWLSVLNLAHVIPVKRPSYGYLPLESRKTCARSPLSTLKLTLQ